jgi:hypothetical protein
MTVEITLVEEIHPFRVYRLNFGLLGRTLARSGRHEGNHLCMTHRSRFDVNGCAFSEFSTRLELSIRA